MKKYFIKIIEKYLYRLADQRLKNKKPFVIAITGSVGKTSTREAVRIVLDNFFPGQVFASRGNMNDSIGLPMAVLGFEYLPTKTQWPRVFFEARRRAKNDNFPKFLILEMGVDKPGDIRYLTSLVKPDISIVTAIAPAHLEGFGDLEGVFKEKTQLFKALGEKGVAIYNHDDLKLVEYAAKIKQQKISYGFSGKSDIQGRMINLDVSGSMIEIENGTLKKRFRAKIIGKHLLNSLLAAAAVAKALKLDFDKSVQSLKEFETLPGRMKLIPGVKDSILIDDSYNANPVSTLAALEVLQDFKSPGRKVAILGNMNELGEFETQGHEIIAKAAAHVCDQLVYIGQNAQLMKKVTLAEALKRRRKIEITVFDTTSRAIIGIDDLIKNKDLILVKASQNKMRFEKIVEALMADPSQAKDLLARQDKRWVKR